MGDEREWTISLETEKDEDGYTSRTESVDGPEVDDVRVVALSRAEAAERLRDELREALRAIRGPEDAGPWIAVYREAGGGYEGLQAIAEAALASFNENGENG